MIAKLQENGRRFASWVGSVPLPVWGFMITQFAVIAVWAIRLEGQVSKNDEYLAAIRNEGTVKSNVNETRLNNLIERENNIEKRLDAWFQDGSLKTNAIDTRLNAVGERLTKVERRQDETGTPALTTLNVTVDKLQSLIERTDRIVKALDTIYDQQQTNIRRLDVLEQRVGQPKR